MNWIPRTITLQYNNSGPIDILQLESLLNICVNNEPITDVICSYTSSLTR